MLAQGMAGRQPGVVKIIRRITPHPEFFHDPAGPDIVGDGKGNDAGELYRFKRITKLVDQGVALFRGKQFGHELHHARIRVQLSERLPIRVSPPPQDESWSYEAFHILWSIGAVRGAPYDQLNGTRESQSTWWVAEVAAGELRTFYYAFFSWRAKPDTRQAWRAFQAGEASGYSMLLTFLALALVFEGVPTHFLLGHWSGPAAWVCTGLTVYGLIWTVAVMRSLRLRPILIGTEGMLLRLGSLWAIEVPREQIVACRPVRGQALDRKQPGYLSLVKLNEPQWLLELARPAVAHGPYGIRKSVRRVAFGVDDAEGFRAAVAELVR